MSDQTKYLVVAKPVRLGWLHRKYWELHILAETGALVGVTQSRPNVADAEAAAQDYLVLEGFERPQINPPHSS